MRWLEIGMRFSAYRHRGWRAGMCSFQQCISIDTFEEIACRKNLRFRHVGSVQRRYQRRAATWVERLLFERTINEVKRKLCETTL